MPIKQFPPKPTQAKPASRRTLARFLEVAVHRHSRFPANSRGQDFYFRLISATHAPTSHVVLGMLYLTKLHTVDSALLYECPGDLVFTACLLLAFGMLDDKPYNTSSWAVLSGHSRQHINAVARRILHTLDHRLAVTPAAFRKYEASMLRFVAAPILPSPPSSPCLPEPTQLHHSMCWDTQRPSSAL